MSVVGWLFLGIRPWNESSGCFFLGGGALGAVSQLCRLGIYIEVRGVVEIHTCRRAACSSSESEYKVGVIRIREV